MKKKIHLYSRIFLINKKFKKNQKYHYIQAPNVIITIPILKNKKFILVSQRREPINKNNYEFPSGWIDKGEKPIQSAARELLEETGFKSIMKPKKLITLYPDPGRLSFKMTCYYTDQIAKVRLPEKGIKIVFCTKNKIFEMIKNNKFNNATHLAVFHHYLFKKNLSFY